MVPHRFARRDSPPPYDESTSTQSSCRKDNTPSYTETGNQIRCPSYEESIADRSDQPPPYTETMENLCGERSRDSELSSESTYVYQNLPTRSWTNTTAYHERRTTGNTRRCHPSVTNNSLRKAFSNNSDRDYRNSCHNGSHGNDGAYNRRQGLSLFDQLTNTPDFRELLGYLN